MRVFLDVVPNHTSDEHRWFVDALAAGPGSPEPARFYFREGRGDHGELPPKDSGLRDIAGMPFPLPDETRVLHHDSHVRIRFTARGLSCTLPTPHGWFYRQSPAKTPRCGIACQDRSHDANYDDWGPPQ